jgi:acetaldehyde dehydrogenase/alcohol dehydrogenase
LAHRGAAVLDAEETVKFTSFVVRRDGRTFDPRIIGQPAQLLADRGGVIRPYPIKLIVIPMSIQAIYDNSPFAREKLAPVLSLFTAWNDEEAFVLCQRILANDGAGHTAIIHTRSTERSDRFGLAMPVSRILVNTPGVHGVSGITTGLVPSYTLGCGTWGGNSTTDNVSFRNLMNIKRIARVTNAGLAG